VSVVGGWRSAAPQQILASQDGSTLAAISTANSGSGTPRPRDITIRVVEAWSGLASATFHPPVSMTFDGLSPDGSQLYGFGESASHGTELYVLNTRDGLTMKWLALDTSGSSRILATSSALFDAATGLLYLLSWPQSTGQGSGPVTPDLLTYDLISGRQVGSLHLDGVLAGGRVSQQGDQAPVISSWQPGFALSPDGSRIAVLDGTSNTLLMVDAKRLTVLRFERLSRPPGFLQQLAGLAGLAPEAALAKEWVGTELTARFSPNGRYLYVTGRQGSVDADGTWTVDGLGLQLVDVSNGRIIAESLPHAWVTALLPDPDGSAIYTEASGPMGGSPVTLRRQDPQTLQVLAQRQFVDGPELHFLTSPALGAPDCRPASPINQNEVRGTPVRGQLWGLLFGRLQAGQQVKIVWRMTGQDPIHLRAVGPDGRHIGPDWGPVRHGGSNWNRPGAEWGTGFTFPTAGCWRVHAARKNTAGNAWFQVAPAAEARTSMPPLFLQTATRDLWIVPFAVGG
jgi:hypothetical protein